MAQAKLQITVISADNLYNADGFLAGKSDPYVICEVPGQPTMKFQTQTLNNDLNPVWNHVGEIEGFMDGDTLEFQVWDSDTFPKPDQLLGKAMLTAQDFYPNGIEGPLLLSDSKTNATLTVRVIVLETTDPTQDPNLVMEGQEGVDYQQVEYQQGMMQGEMAGGVMAEQVSGPQTLHINIMNARGLYNADGILAGKSDPYCVCLIPEKKHVKITTNTINNCLDPDWNYTGLIHGFEAGDSLEFQVWDSDTFPKPDQLLGSVTLSPQDFANNPAGIEGVLQLTGGLSKEMGTLEVKIAVDAQATIDDAVAAEAHAAHHSSSGHAATAGSTTHQPGAKRLSITQQTVEKLAGAKMAKLKVTIFSASGLYNADGFLAGKSDPYVICQVPESKAQKFKTKVMSNTLEPSWNHLGVINGFVVGHTLELLVYDSDTPPKPDQLLGKVVLSSDDFFPQGLEGALLLAESKAAGATISVRIEVLPDTKDTGLAGGVRITSGGTYPMGQVRPSVYQYPTGQPVYYQQPYPTAGNVQYMAPSPTYTYTTVPQTVVQGAVAQTAFEAIDTNHDGVITRSEFATAVGEPAAVQPVATKVEYASAPMTYTAQAPVVYTMPPQPTATAATTIAATAMTAPAADLSATTRAPVVSYITTGMPATAATASAVLPSKPVVTAAPTTFAAPTYTLAPGSPVSYVKQGAVATESAGTVVKMQPTVTTSAAPAAAPVTIAQAPAASYRLPGGATRTTYVSAASAGSGTPYTVVAAPSATTLGAATTYAVPHRVSVSGQTTTHYAPSILTSGVSAAAAAPVATQVTGAATATRVYAAAPGATYTMAPTVTTMAPVVTQGVTQGPTLFDRLDKNHDGVISRAEFASAVR